MTSIARTATALNNVVAVLGAPDPEMNAIEALLVAAGVEIVYATINGMRVRPDQAYLADPIQRFHAGVCEDIAHILRIECDWDGTYDSLACGVTVIDHHRPGDPGYGVGPEGFMAASSLGQVIAYLTANGHPPSIVIERNSVATYTATRFRTKDGIWQVRHTEEYDNGGYEAYRDVWYQVPHALVMTAAADHCLPHAYAGKCTAVCPDELGEWRARSRAEFQNTSADKILARIAIARQKLVAAPHVYLYLDHDEQGNDVYESAKDVREIGPVDELPEACARDGVAVIYQSPERLCTAQHPKGRFKVGILSGTPEQIRAFMTRWAPTNGLEDIYGDPARGYAGGYKA